MHNEQIEYRPEALLAALAAKGVLDSGDELKSQESRVIQKGHGENS
ncbi:MAG: hypothetical protein ACLGQX_06505 [Acidobacteriota bacterium]